MTLLILNGCASYRSDLQGGLNELQKGNISRSKSIFEKQLNNPDDELLRYLELGLLNHLEGDYEQSNRLLNQAEYKAEILYTRKFSDMFVVAMSNPRSGPYRGNRFERVFIHYYKALNYLALAFRQQQDFKSLLDEAQVEARKVDVLLNAISYATGEYGVVDSASKSFFMKVLNSLTQLGGARYDTDAIRYREDGYIRYMMGLIYELGGEIDDARIAYEKAAKIYEAGFASQHHLGTEITELAWFDVVRMMRKKGGYESQWQRLASEKLSEGMQQKLEQFNDKQGQLIVLHHQGMIESRGQIELNAYINPYLKELVIRPFGTGSAQMRQAQHAWFQYVYADQGLFGMLRNYYSGGPFGTLEGVFTKKIVLMPVWNTMTNTGVDKLLRQSLRVTVPYYQPPHKPRQVVIEIDDMFDEDLVLSQWLSSLAIQDQLQIARSELYEAISRELLKRRLAHEIGKRSDKNTGELFSFLAGIVVAATSAAETRNWLSLPASIQVQRFALAPGRHHVRLYEVDERSGERNIVSTAIDISSGKDHLLNTRSFTKGAIVNYYAHKLPVPERKTNEVGLDDETQHN
jgi:hypothetical protein